ncbi:MAG: tripartite tricarboxylate transporter TctB family protein [Burkholderiaceae bacterium]
MIARTTLSDLLLVAAGVVACIGGWRLGVGAIRAPEAGLMPFLVGFILVLLGGYGLVVPRALRASREDAAALPPLFNTPSAWAFAVLATIGLAVAVRFLSLAPAVFLFVFALHASVKPRRLSVSAFYAAVVATVSWLVFVYWFGLAFV